MRNKFNVDDFIFRLKNDILEEFDSDPDVTKEAIRDFIDEEIHEATVYKQDCVDILSQLDEWEDDLYDRAATLLLDYVREKIDINTLMTRLNPDFEEDFKIK
jgi:hypothetical protein